jgi:hypothetical protein
MQANPHALRCLALLSHRPAQWSQWSQWSHTVDPVLSACLPCWCWGGAMPRTQFTSVNVLSILIDGNQGDEDITRVFKIALAGIAGDTFNVAEIKKQEDKS